MRELSKINTHSSHAEDNKLEVSYYSGFANQHLHSLTEKNAKYSGQQHQPRV